VRTICLVFVDLTGSGHASFEPPTLAEFVRETFLCDEIAIGFAELADDRADVLDGAAAREVTGEPEVVVGHPAAWRSPEQDEQAQVASEFGLGEVGRIRQEGVGPEGQAGKLRHELSQQDCR